MERHFDQDLQQLKERILYMGSLAETMIHIAIKALVDRRWVVPAVAAASVAGGWNIHTKMTMMNGFKPAIHSNLALTSGA